MQLVYRPDAGLLLLRIMSDLQRHTNGLDRSHNVNFGFDTALRALPLTGTWLINVANVTVLSVRWPGFS
jgi:hypothetical protein